MKSELISGSVSPTQIQTKNFNWYRKWINEYWGCLLWRYSRIMRFLNGYFYRFNSLKLLFLCRSVSDSDLFKIIPVLSNKKISRVQNGNLGGDSKVTNRKPVKPSWLKTLEFVGILNLRYECNNFGLQIQNELQYIGLHRSSQFTWPWQNKVTLLNATPEDFLWEKQNFIS